MFMNVTKRVGNIKYQIQVGFVASFHSTYFVPNRIMKCENSKLHSKYSKHLFHLAEKSTFVLKQILHK